MARRQFAGGAARTTLAGDIASSGGGSVVITSATGWPDGSVGPFMVIVDPGGAAEEKILVDSRVGTTLNFSVDGRAYDGTSTTSHATGATIWHMAGAVDFDEANAHINQASGAHTAAQVSFSPTGTIAATTVQAAIAEVATEGLAVNAEARLTALESATSAHDTAINDIESDNWVTQVRMADSSVGTAELIGASVTAAKLALALPRGFVAYATVTSNPAAFDTVQTNLPGATVTFTAPASRRYRISVQVMFVISANTTTPMCVIAEGGSQLQAGIGHSAGPGTFVTCQASLVVTPSAGSHTYTLAGVRSAGSGSLTTSINAARPDFILVEDIGAA